MAQSALTVTPPSPTPPTNMSFVGATGPNPPNFTKVNYAEPFGARDAGGFFTDETPPGVRVNPNPPPYFDDGAAGPLHTAATNTAALASGTGATSGGTENTYPGIGGLTPPAPNMGGAVPASTSVAHEAAGTETRVLAPGNISHTYVVGTLDMSQSISTGPVITTQAQRDAGPNSSHASSDSATPAAAPTITGLLPVAPVSNAGGGTTTLTVNGTNFTPSAVVLIGGVAYPTQYNSPTQLKVMNAPVRLTAGNTAVTVRVGATTTAATNWVFS